MRIFSPNQGCFMKRQYKKPQLFIFKIFLILYKVCKFILIMFLHLFSSNSKNKKRYQPTLQEQIMGENIPFSDQYYIPDDKH